MNRSRPRLIFVFCAVFWGVIFSPVLLRIDSGYESIRFAMAFLCAANILASLGMKKILKTDIQPGFVGILFSLFYTFVVCMLVLLAFQFYEAKYG